MDSVHQIRMNNSYPPVIKDIYEFQAIINGEYPEFDLVSDTLNKVTDESYWYTMSEERISNWEKKLGIIPIADSYIEDRRDSIIARILGQGKLNTELINRIVYTFTGGTAESWVENDVIHIEINPPEHYKDFKFENLRNELLLKIPLHLGVDIVRQYVLWAQVNISNRHWKDVNIFYNTWSDVFYNNRIGLNQLDITTFEKFILG